jgi:prolipoprotein diacylglyceryltransferase
MTDFPWRFQIVGQVILLHAVFEFLAFFIGFRYYLFLRTRQGDRINADNRIWIIIGAIFGAVIGSRLVGGLESIEQLKKAQNPWIHFYGNKSVVGGFLGGLFGVEIIKKLINEKQRSGDLFVYPMLFALIAGRIGCFSMGVHEDVYGVPTRFFTGINLGDGLLRHPLMLYEMLFLGLLWMFIASTKRRYCQLPGDQFKLFMICYLLFRFCIEFLKAREQYFLALGAIQVACLAGLVYYRKDVLIFINRTFQPVTATITN